MRLVEVQVNEISLSSKYKLVIKYCFVYKEISEVKKKMFNFAIFRG